MYPPAEIATRTVTDFSFHSKPGIEEVKLKVEVNTGFGTPKSETSRTGLIHAVLSMEADEPEDYSILFVENIEVTFEERPGEFDKALHSYFESIGITIVSDDFDKALEGINRPPMKIKESY